MLRFSRFFRAYITKISNTWYTKVLSIHSSSTCYNSLLLLRKSVHAFQGLTKISRIFFLFESATGNKFGCGPIFCTVTHMNQITLKMIFINHIKTRIQMNMLHSEIIYYKIVKIIQILPLLYIEPSGGQNCHYPVCRNI